VNNPPSNRQPGAARDLSGAMKVLMIVPMSKAQTMPPVLRQVESLRSRGVDIDFFAVDGPPVLKYVRAAPAVVARSRAADLVHGHYGYCGWLARLQIGRPVVVSFMGSDLLGTPDFDGRLTWFSRLVIRADRLLARIADRVIVKSSEMAEIVAPVRADVVPNGVDLEAFRPLDRDEARARLGWRRDARYVLFGSNPRNPRKGFPLAENAVAHVRKCIGDVEIVALWGVAADDVPVYMSAADVLLMTSLLEGSPNVVKEAMACGLPVVAVRVGDVAELVDGVDVGALVESRDPEAISVALQQILQSRARSTGREALKAKGLALEDVAKRLCAIYDEVCEGGGGRPIRRAAVPRHQDRPFDGSRSNESISASGPHERSAVEAGSRTATSSASAAQSSATRTPFTASPSLSAPADGRRHA
jgi:glycosyltransferase involved in cell wall biosynthesis